MTSYLPHIGNICAFPSNGGLCDQSHGGSFLEAVRVGSIDIVQPVIAIAYLIAGVCVILALRRLSLPATSQRGNRLGMISMVAARMLAMYKKKER